MNKKDKKEKFLSDFKLSDKIFSKKAKGEIYLIVDIMDNQFQAWSYKYSDLTLLAFDDNWQLYVPPVPLALYKYKYADKWYVTTEYFATNGDFEAALSKVQKYVRLSNTEFHD